MEFVNLGDFQMPDDFDYYCNKYGRDYVLAVISNELQLYCDNFDEELFESYKDICPDLLKKEE